jgi:hypothetical protein
MIPTPTHECRDDHGIDKLAERGLNLFSPWRCLLPEFENVSHFSSVSPFQPPKRPGKGELRERRFLRLQALCF